MLNSELCAWGILIGSAMANGLPPVFTAPVGFQEEVLNSQINDVRGDLSGRALGNCCRVWNMVYGGSFTVEFTHNEGADLNGAWQYDCVGLGSSYGLRYVNIGGFRWGLSNAGGNSYYAYATSPLVYQETPCMNDGLGWNNGWAQECKEYYTPTTISTTTTSTKTTEVPASECPPCWEMSDDQLTCQPAAAYLQTTCLSNAMEITMHNRTKFFFHFVRIFPLDYARK